MSDKRREFTLLHNLQRHLGQSEFRFFVYHWLRALAMLDGAFDVIAIVLWIRKFVMPADFFDKSNKKTQYQYTES